MQKRFCSCGHMFLVRYLSSNGLWQPLFIQTQQPRVQTKITVSVCPSCGAALSIHSLR